MYTRETDSGTKVEGREAEEWGGYHTRDEELHLQIVSVSRINIFWGFWSSYHDPILDGF